MLELKTQICISIPKRFSQLFCFGIERRDLLRHLRLGDFG